MNRREFLKGTTAAMAASAIAAQPALSEKPLAAARSVLPLNRNWRYHPAWLAGAETPEFDDLAFARVVVPHANIRLPWHNFDDKSYQFISTYRRKFRLPQDAVGKRVFVDFEGVMTASTVWINGISLGEYKGGYTPFSFELTPHLQDGDNVLAVKMDSTERPDIPPSATRSIT